MKKFLLFLSFILITTACGRFDQGMVDYKDLTFQKVQWAEGDFYFAHPGAAKVDMAEKKLSYEDCEVHFGDGFSARNHPWEHKVKKDAGVTYDAWYGTQNDLLAYQAVVDVVNFSFWVQAGDAQYCASFVDSLAQSFSDEPRYINETYGFSLEFPEGYSVQRLPNDGGLRLEKQDISPLDPKDKAQDFPDGVKHYTSEIVVLPFENEKRYPDLTAFIIGEYDGYTSEFVTYEGVSGFYVGDGNTLESTSYFFAMDPDAEVIYEFYMRLPNIYYNAQREKFEKMISSLRLM